MAGRGEVPARGSRRFQVMLCTIPAGARRDDVASMCLGVRFSAPKPEAGLLGAGPASDDNLLVHTILIVDDHVQFRATARALLECDGFEVVGEAPTGAAGLDAARTLQPDVVLLDVRLPDIDGFAMAERLTAGGQGPAVILTSSSDDPLYPERATSSGARGFVAKHDVSGAALNRLLG